MLDRAFSVAISERKNSRLLAHLVRQDLNEDLTFALYEPVSGSRRDTAIITDLILPTDGDRSIHGNVSFGPQYFERAITTARRRRSGLALIHSHPFGKGWQALSRDDDLAERRLAPATLGATRLPLVGMTLASTDSTWSARRWIRCGPKTYQNNNAENVRVVGQRLHISIPSPTAMASDNRFERTVSAWGSQAHARISSLRVGIVGLGSVGSIIAESIARIGVRNITLVDHDLIELRNLDRTLNANSEHINRKKVDVAFLAVEPLAKESGGSVITIAEKCDNPIAYKMLLDCDILFCCVDRPWPRRILNQLSYSSLIPVSNGGLLVRNRRGRLIGADWHVHLVGPGRRCMQCWKAFDPSEAALERDGFLDDPTYVKELDPESPLVAHANALPYSLGVASMQLSQAISLVGGPIHNVGDWNFHASTGSCDVTADPGCQTGCPYEEMTGNPKASPPTLQIGD